MSPGWTTLCLMAATVGLVLPPAGWLAWLVETTDLPFRRLHAALLLILLPLPTYLTAGAWIAGFGPQGGWTLLVGGPPWLEGFRGAVLLHAIAAFPWAVLILRLGIRRLDPRLFEQGATLLPPVRMAVVLLLPHLGPSLAAAAGLTAIAAGTEILVTDLFRVRTAAEEIYRQLAGDPDPGAAWQAVRGTAATQGLLVLVALGLAGAWARVPQDMPAVAPPRRPLGTLRLPLGIAALILPLGLLLIPTFDLIRQAGLHVAAGPSGPVPTFSPAKVFSLMLEAWVRFDPAGGLRAGRFLPELLRGFGLAALVAATTVPLAAAAGWWARRAARRQTALWAATVPAWAVPAPLLGLAVASVCSRPDLPWLNLLYDRTVFAPWLVQSVRAWPWAVAVLLPAMRALPESRLELARTAGLHGWALGAKCVLPLLRGPLLLAAGLTALASLSELGATILVAPPGFELPSVRVFNLLHYGLDDLVAGLYLGLVVPWGVVAAVWTWFDAESDPSADRKTV